MLVFETVLVLSAAYSVGYGIFCIRQGRGGAAGALILASLPLALFVTLVCIS